MTTNNTLAQVIELEASLRGLSRQLTTPRPGECLHCYVIRMLPQFGCSGLTWATRYRDLQAPRATALARRLSGQGAFCDCEIFLNSYSLAPDLLTYDPATGDYVVPDVPPGCRGVRAGSVQPCRVWTRRRRDTWW